MPHHPSPLANITDGSRREDHGIYKDDHDELIPDEEVWSQLLNEGQASPFISIHPCTITAWYDFGGS